MGSRKRNSANKRKEARKNIVLAQLRNCPSSPKKMKLVIDIIRGKSVEQALHILKTSGKEAATKLHKLLLSTIANWQNKNEGLRIEEANLYVKEIFVNQGRTLKRIQPAPQGRAHRIRKRSNHVTIIVEGKSNLNLNNKEKELEKKVETSTTI